jgi:DNA polymerase-3 subunit delta
MIATFSGTNAFALRAELAAVTDKFVKEYGDFALERLDGDESSYEQILGAIESLPFLATRKMVQVENLSLNKIAAELLDQLIDRAGDTTDLVIVESKLDKRGSFYKQLQKLTDFKDFSEMDESSLAGWLVNAAKQQGGMLGRPDAGYLVQRVGVNQLRLSNELQKLVQYNPKVNRASIDLLTAESTRTTIFNLIDSVFSGNVRQALNIYDEQRKQRIEPQAIHGMLVWQMHAVAVAVSMPAGADSHAVAKESGLSPYVLQKSQSIARKMGRQRVIEFMQLLRDIDYRGKREPLDYDEALQYAIISLA